MITAITGKIEITYLALSFAVAIKNPKNAETTNRIKKSYFFIGLY